MNHTRTLILTGFTLLISSVGLFLSLWVWLPAPTFSLLPLSVGMPEISPGLAVGNAIALGLANRRRKTLAQRIALGISSLALALSLWPLSQLPAALSRANTAMTDQLGASVLQMSNRFSRSVPFSLKTIFLGLPIPAVHHRSGIVFAKPDGVPLTLEIDQPPEPGQYPTILTIYGGAWQRGSPTDNAKFNRYLAAQGYTVIALDYRHAPQYRFPAQLEDGQSALAFIQAHAVDYGVDLSRMAIIGRSAGAQLALLLAYQSDPATFRGVVNFYGPVDLATAYHNPPIPDPIQTRSVLTAFLGGEPETIPETYRQASPLYAIHGNLPPTLTLQGLRDHIVEAKYSRLLTDQLQTQANSAVLIELPWADHVFDAVFRGMSNQITLYYLERFLAHVLQ